MYNDGNLEIMERQLTSILEKLNERDQVIILGDFNIDMLENTRKKNEWLNFLSSYGIQQTIFEPTRITPAISTCIDGICKSRLFCGSSANTYIRSHSSINLFQSHESTVKICT